ncbi:MAG: hypothetical protein ACJA0H_002363 [Francisellaceae bacterium]|jgi:hypothetical protein
MLEFDFPDDEPEIITKNYTVVDCNQGTNEWLDAKLGVLSASNMNIMFGDGVTKEKLIASKVAEILTGKLDDRIRFSSKDTSAGNDLEDDARVSYEELTGNEVKQIGFALLDQFVGVSPDGLVGDNGAIEIKCPNDANYINAVIGGKAHISPLYMTQMQMQMYVLELEWCDYTLYNPNFETSLHIIRIERDNEAIELIKKQIEIIKKQIVNKINNFNQKTRKIS